MSDIDVKQGWPPLPQNIRLVLYIEELETFLDKFNMESLYLFNTMVVIRFYVDNNVLLSRLEASLHRLLHKLNEFCTSSSLESQSI